MQLASDTGSTPGRDLDRLAKARQGPPNVAGQIDMRHGCNISQSRQATELRRPDPCSYRTRNVVRSLLASQSSRLMILSIGNITLSNLMDTFYCASTPHEFGMARTTMSLLGPYATWRKMKLELSRASPTGAALLQPLGGKQGANLVFP